MPVRSSAGSVMGGSNSYSLNLRVGDVNLQSQKTVDNDSASCNCSKLWHKEDEVLTGVMAPSIGVRLPRWPQKTEICEHIKTPTIQSSLGRWARSNDCSPLRQLRGVLCEPMPTYSNMSTSSRRATDHDPERLQSCLVNSPEFQIILAKSSTLRVLGVKLTRAYDRMLLIEKFGRQGLIPKWNHEHPTLQVQTGDLIVEVNGKRSDTESMLTQIMDQDQELLHLVLRRPGPL